MAEENPNARWRKMTEAEEKLAAKDQIKATKAQTKATEKVADSFDDMKDQFKAMHDDLDKLGAATQEQTQATKEQTKNETEDQKEKKQDKKVAKANKKKSALDDLRAQVRRSQIEQGLSAKDVAAEHIAGGGGVGGAIKAAAGFKVGQLKHKFDPLNIVKKITGGSKLLTALAGKVMGRSEKAIREFTDLAPGQELPTSFSGKASRVGGGYGEGPSRVSGGDSSGILNTIAANVSKILERLTAMETSTEKQEKLAQQQLDSQKDANALAGAKSATTPSRMGKIVEKVKAGAGGIGDFLQGLIDKFKLPLLLAIGALVVAGKMLYDQWENLKKSFGFLKDSAVDMWEGIKNAFTSAGQWISAKVLQITDTVMDMFDSIVEYIKDVAGKFIPGYTPDTAEQKQTKLETAAKGGDARAQRKLASQNTEKVAAPGESAAAVAKLATSFTGKIPEGAQSNAAEGLKQGAYDAAATDSLMGVKAPSGTPEEKATTSAVTQLATRAYGEVYKDEQGKPLTPSADKSSMKASRVASMVSEASKALGASLSTAPQTTISPTEIPVRAPVTGQTLNDSAEFQKSAATGAASGDSISKSTINVKNNNVNSTTIQQRMASPRSGESSFLRSNDRAFSPA